MNALAAEKQTPHLEGSPIETTHGQTPHKEGPSDEQGAKKTVFAILLALSFSHLLNDTVQSLIPSLYPLFKESFGLSFTRVGLITFTFQLTASLLQPLVGYCTDRKPMPYSLATGLGFTLVGLGLLSVAHSFTILLISVALVGMGSAVFHPESSRIAHLAAGERHGFAQSFFQLGGNFGSSLGPLLAVLVLVQFQIAWFSLAALLAIVVLSGVGRWYQKNRVSLRAQAQAQVRRSKSRAPISRGKIGFAVTILMALIFSKYFYIASLSSYYTFYLMDKFHVSVQSAQIHLFVFLFSVAAGTLVGGSLGDRFGRKYVIWVSILGTAPFSLLLPHASLLWTGVLTVFIGLILSSAFSAILVYAQELIPGRVGLIAGLFFGLAFGMAGIGSAVLGKLADSTSIQYVFNVCAYLPLIGLLTGFLPNLDGPRRARGVTSPA